jgi:hypothetical protein
MLAAGFVVMILGSGVLIYMTIKDEEAGEKETSDAVKKIILNFLQMLSLAAGLPLQWTPEIEAMFQTMATMSSAGTTLLVPDCELTHLATIDAFYYKQIFFTFLVPIIVVVCLLAWALIFCTCARCKKCRIAKRNYKNYTILSIVLMLFLFYPMLVKFCFSMLKCVLVGEKRYLMADLEEVCFEGRHLEHLLLLTIPQLILVVMGLPFLSVMIILRNNHHFERYDFRIRYGLLYLGYRENREWWEVVVAFRKVLIVLIGSLGTVMGAVDLQAFLALFLIFLALLLHLTGKPFDTTKPKMLLLHQLELGALSLCWATFWGGMLFYLGHEQPEIIAPWVRIVMSVLIVLVNTLFLIFACYEFVKEFINDYKHKAEVRRKTLLSMNLQEVNLNSMKSLVRRHQQQQYANRGKKNRSAIVPINGGGVVDELQWDTEEARSEKEKAKVRSWDQ